MSSIHFARFQAPAPNFRAVWAVAYGGARYTIATWLSSPDLIVKTTHYDSGSDFIPDPGLIWEGTGNHRDLSRALNRLHFFGDFSFVNIDPQSLGGFVPFNYHERQMRAGDLYQRGRNQLERGRIGAAALLMEKALLYLDL